MFFFKVFIRTFIIFTLERQYYCLGSSFICSFIPLLQAIKEQIFEISNLTNPFKLPPALVCSVNEKKFLLLSYKSLFQFYYISSSAKIKLVKSILLKNVANFVKNIFFNSTFYILKYEQHTNEVKKIRNYCKMLIYLSVVKFPVNKSALCNIKTII